MAIEQVRGTLSHQQWDPLQPVWEPGASADAWTMCWSCSQLPRLRTFWHQENLCAGSTYSQLYQSAFRTWQDSSGTRRFQLPVQLLWRLLSSFDASGHRHSGLMQCAADQSGTGWSARRSAAAHASRFSRALRGCSQLAAMVPFTHWRGIERPDWGTCVFVPVALQAGRPKLPCRLSWR